jgi:hypothetical protein
MKINDTFSTEYLIIIDKNTAGAYFNLINTTSRFNELIKNETEISVKNNKIIFNKQTFDYKVRHGVVANKDQRYFYTTISTQYNDFSSYTKLLRKIKTVLNQQKFIIETLQDDLSFHYSTKAYSMIHEIENLMRKFITFLMIANVGRDWVTQNIPNQVKVALEKSKHRDYASELQKVDFKDLGYLLFNQYQKSDVAMLQKKIADYNDVNEINLDDLKSFIPSSNWDNYFKDNIDIDGLSLKKKWERLYELRNYVAHTSSLNEDKYQEIEELVNSMLPVLKKAFDTLGKVKLDNSDRLAISERLVTTLDSKVGSYFSEINNLEEEIRALSPLSKHLPLEQLIDELIRDGLIEKLTADKIRKLIKLKGSVSFDSIPSEENIDAIGISIDELKNQMQKTWSKEVYLAMKELNEKSSLDSIYEQVRLQTKRHLFGSWKTSVRRAIYSNSSDVELFNGKYDIYQQVSKGVWTIRKNIDSTLLIEFLGSKNA